VTDFAPIFFGLVSAACWGAGDFSGGMATKRAGVFSVVIASQFIGALLLTLLAILFAEQMPPLDHFVLASVGGVAGAIGLMALYRALASGQMGVAAPVAAVVSAISPVIFGIFIEGLPGVLKLIGFGLALISVWFVSHGENSRINFQALKLPILAGIGFGIFLIILHQVSDTAVLWPLVGARAGSLIVLVAVASLTRQQRLPGMRLLPLTALAGMLDAGGNAFYILAGQTGRLDVAAVLSSLYPASTVLLAWLILKERISFRQQIGIATALAAIILIST
jgi:drug/metabolite transporter (DMT)-like permease